jgi:hypothetical protein
MRFYLLAVIVLIAACLYASDDALNLLLEDLLLLNTDYQQALTRWEQTRSTNRIDKSLRWFDVNLIYRDIDNKIFRDERSNYVELTDIDETDRRWTFELNRTFFPKDFDDASDDIKSKIDLLRYEYELTLCRLTSLEDIFSDFIDWYEAANKMKILQQRLEILLEENSILEKLFSENKIETEMLILNLEEIENREDDYYDFKEIADYLWQKYDFNFEQLQNLMLESFPVIDSADTNRFNISIDQRIKTINQQNRPIAKTIKANRSFFFLPEIDLSLSYQQRRIKQKWDIDKDGSFRLIDRKQNEDFWQGEIEISLPFNIFSNLGGKYSILKSFERELYYRTRNLIDDWQKFRIDRLTSLLNYTYEYKRKSRLAELYQINLKTMQKKVEYGSYSLVGNPQIRIKKERIKADQSELELKIAYLKIWKETYLINSFEEGKK